jgi:hypothetical protein
LTRRRPHESTRFSRYTLRDSPADSPAPHFQPKNQAIGLLSAVAYLKLPLIVLNAIIIVVELLFG